MTPNFYLVSKSWGKGKFALFFDLSNTAENNAEVDFVVEKKGKVYSLEIKSSYQKINNKGQEIFANKFNPDATLLIGPEGVSAELFITTTIENFLS